MAQNVDVAISDTLRTIEECDLLLSRVEKEASQSTPRVTERNVVNDTATPVNKSKSKNRSANQAALKLLMETYPEVFNRENVRPLKIGIQEDLIEDGKVAKNKIKRALASYVRAPQYFRSMVEGADRVNLQGESAGAVTAEEAAHALEKLKEFKKRRREIQLEREKAEREQRKVERLNNKLEQLVTLNKR